MPAPNLLDQYGTIDVTPGVSSSAQPGYIINPNVAGNNAWREAALDILAYQWASTPPDQRDSFLQPYWGQGAVNGRSQYGDADMTDRVGADGIVYTSPATVASLSRYLSSYVPGSNPDLEGLIPYVPPAPNEYIESPDAIAARVNQFNNDRNFALDVAQENRIAGDNRASIAASNANAAASRAAAAQASQNQLAAASMAADASRFGTRGQFLSSIYNTDAGLWDAGQRNLLDAMQGAGSLSLGYQGLLDERVKDIIRNKSNPQDFVERQYSIRALQPPTGTDITAYRDVPELQGSISKLYNYNPPAQPTAPKLGAGGMVNDEIFRVGEKSAPAQKDTTEVIWNPTRAPIAVVPTNETGRALSQAYNGYAPGTLPGYVNTYLNDQGLQYNDETGLAETKPEGDIGDVATGPASPRGYTPYSWDELYSSGKRDVIAANPYASQPLYQDAAGTVIRVDPATGMRYQVYRPQTGTVNYPSENVRTTQPISGAFDTSQTWNVARKRTAPPRNYSENPLGSGTTTTPAGGQINNTQNPPPPPVTPVTPVTPAAQLPASELNTIFKDYTDAEIQAMPFLQYLMGLQSPEQFNTLSTAFTNGPFGTALPEAGGMNLRKIWEISQDPDALGMLSSLYGGANRNLAALIALAAQRAPVGNAQATSGIQT